MGISNFPHLEVIPEECTVQEIWTAFGQNVGALENLFGPRWERWFADLRANGIWEKWNLEAAQLEAVVFFDEGVKVDTESGINTINPRQLACNLYQAFVAIMLGHPNKVPAGSLMHQATEKSGLSLIRLVWIDGVIYPAFVWKRGEVSEPVKAVIMAMITNGRRIFLGADDSNGFQNIVMV